MGYEPLGWLRQLAHLRGHDRAGGWLRAGDLPARLHVDGRQLPLVGPCPAGVHQVAVAPGVPRRDGLRGRLLVSCPLDDPR